MGKEYSFKICHPERDTFYFQAKSKAEQLCWIRCLVGLIEGAKVPDNREILHQVTCKAKSISIAEDDLSREWVDLCDVISETVVPTEQPQKTSFFLFSSTSTQPSDSSDFSERLLHLFSSYADVPMISADDSDSDEEPYIAPRGLGQLCVDIGVDPEDVSLLIWAYHLKAEKCGFFTRKEFIDGMTKLGIDTRQKLKTELQKMKKNLHADKEHFSNVYKFAFQFSLEGENKGIDIPVAVFLLNLLMSGKPHTQTLIEYLQEQTEVKRITPDTWAMILSFSDQIKPDLSNYDLTSCWPVVLDSYADWLSERLEAKK